MLLANLSNIFISPLPLLILPLHGDECAPVPDVIHGHAVAEKRRGQVEEIAVDEAEAAAVVNGLKKE